MEASCLVVVSCANLGMRTILGSESDDYGRGVLRRGDRNEATVHISGCIFARSCPVSFRVLSGAAEGPNQPATTVVYCLIGSIFEAQRMRSRNRGTCGWRFGRKYETARPPRISDFRHRQSSLQIPICPVLPRSITELGGATSRRVAAGVSGRGGSKETARSRSSEQRSERGSFRSRRKGRTRDQTQETKILFAEVGAAPSRWDQLAAYASRAAQKKARSR